MVFSKLTLPLMGLLAIIDAKEMRRSLSGIGDILDERQCSHQFEEECFTKLGGEMMDEHTFRKFRDSLERQMRRRALSGIPPTTRIDVPGFLEPGARKPGAFGKCFCVFTETGVESTVKDDAHGKKTPGGPIGADETDNESSNLALITRKGFAYDINDGVDLEKCPPERNTRVWYTYNGVGNNACDWGKANEKMPRGFSGGPSCKGGQSRSHGGTCTEAQGCYNSQRWNTDGPAQNWGNTFDPRQISDEICKQGIDDRFQDGGNPVPAHPDASDACITYGQVMDHELDATNPDDPVSPSSVTVGDSCFHMTLDRTNENAENGITSFVDGGIVYGESTCEVSHLSVGRHMKTSGAPPDIDIASQFLPVSQTICRNTVCNVPGEAPSMANPTKRACFYAGDFRANENPALVAYHTLFLRLHNWIAKKFPRANFEQVRAGVIYAEQNITYGEWLGAWTANRDKAYKFSNKKIELQSGRNALRPYDFDERVRPSTRHIFASATYRQHTGVSGVMKLEGALSPRGDGKLELDQSYFESCVWYEDGAASPGCDPGSSGGGNLSTTDTDVDGDIIQSLCSILAGQSEQEMRLTNTRMITEERNQLFYKAPLLGNHDEGGLNGYEGSNLDLSTLNLFRGRDQNIATWASVFRAFFASGPNAYPSDSSSGQMTNAIDASAIGLYSTGGSSMTSAFHAAYGDFRKVDLWSGALAEPKLEHTNGNGKKQISVLGPTLTLDNVTQFWDIRDGDRFFVDRTFLSSPNYPSSWTVNTPQGFYNQKGLKYDPRKFTMGDIMFLTSGVQCQNNPFLNGANCKCAKEGVGRNIPGRPPLDLNNQCGWTA